MVVRAILSIEEDTGCHFDRENTRILDFGCGKGRVGDVLKSQGFDQIYGQEFSERLAERCISKGNYKDVE